MANLLTICTRALDDISSLNVPTFIVGNDDDTAKSALSAAFKVGEELTRDYDWQELSRTATVTTVDTVSLYDLPADYDRVASDTMWNGTDKRYMRGQTTKRQWAAITNSSATTSYSYFWRLFGGQIQLQPAAQGVFTFDYEYLTKSYCTDSNGVVRVDGWTADTDLPLLRDDIFIAGVRYYFSKSKGLPYGEAEAEYEAVIDSRFGKNTPSQAINMAASVYTPRDNTYFDRLNIPDRVDL